MRGWSNYFRHAVAKHLRHARHLPLVASDPMAETTAPLEVEGYPPTPHGPQRSMAETVGGRDRPVQPRCGIGLLDTGTAATRSPVPGPRPTTPDSRNRGEPGAWRHARRVRRAARRNGPVATPAPRCGPTQPSCTTTDLRPWRDRRAVDQYLAGLTPRTIASYGE
ncbi:hypothetical protein [Nocardia alni]|uniref:hypothetical protein n=1 Tax=Nocardia alni TaxID=2815723 RepID=UPI0020B2FC52|nr:hypothetical protein [Nocardia alni]